MGADPSPSPLALWERGARGVRVLLLFLLCLPLPAPAQPAEPAPTITIGSKNFAESRLLGELFAQLLEARTDLRVERSFGLAGTQVCFEALKSGAIDLYPEYTGTGLVSILGREPGGGSPGETLVRVRREFLQRWDLHWLAPLGFENAYEIAVPQALAEARGLRTLSDLVPIAGELTAGFGYEFVERGDGLPGLREVYGLDFARVQTLQQALKYQAAGAGQVDALDVYTTDGRLLTYALVILEDDRGFFPPYQAVPLVRGETLRQHPEVGAVLALLADALEEATMRQLNYRLQEGQESEATVARDALRALGLIAGGKVLNEEPPAEGFLPYLWQQRSTLGTRTLEHLGLTAVALGCGILLAVPLGLLLERRRTVAEPVIRAVGLLQTVPSLALLAFMVPLLGIGVVPALVALWLYSLFPILRNSYTGVRDADPLAVESAVALGMTPGQILRQIRLPLATPVILAGVRTAGVLTVGTATLAAFIGAGGLGEPIITGLQLGDHRRILAGAIPAALLALGLDALLGAVERALRPRGLKG
jgi:osmoprotectant transport system permease protein